MMKILIVEDEEHYGEFLERIIGKRYSCARARDGNEAKSLIMKNSYDIVIYDLRLPGLVGRDLIRYVRNMIDPDIVNIVVTGFEEDWPAVEATEEHIFFYLRKGTFKPGELMKVIDSAAQLRQLKLKEKSYIKNLIAAEKLSSTGKLAIGIAHEINNPLQSMMAITEVIKKKLRRDTVPQDTEPVEKALPAGEREPIAADLAILEKGMTRIKSVIKQLIDLHRIDFNTRNDNSFVSIVERVVSFIRPIAKEKNTAVTLHNTVRNSNIYVSENQLFHVLLNICMNLLDYNNESILIETRLERGCIAIQVKAVRASSPKADHGEDAARAEGDILGESLSLEISRSIIHHFGGTIKLNETEKGELITIRFPYSEVENSCRSAPLGCR
jgi:signal transduction histidine kinase